MSQTASSSVLPAVPTSVRWQIVGLLVAYSFMTWFNRVSIQVAYDVQISQNSQYGITDTQAGLISSVFLWAYTVCMTPGGWLIDRIGPWAALFLMGFGSAVFGALTAIGGHPALVSAGLMFSALLVIRALMGVVTAPVYPASSRLVAHWMPLSQRRLGNGFVQGAAAVGISCTFPVFGWLTDQVGWQLGFVITGSFTALIALVWTVYATNLPSQHRLVNEAERHWIEAGNPVSQPRHDETPWWTLLGNRSLVLLTISYAAIGYVEYLFFFWVHHYFKDIREVGDKKARLYSAIVTLAMAVGMIAGGAVAEWLRRTIRGRWGTALLPLVALTAAAVFVILGLLAEQTAWVVLWLSLALAAVGATEAPVWTMAIELGGRRGGTAAGICNTGGNVLGAAAPTLTPILSAGIIALSGVSEKESWQWAISVGSVVAISGAVLWLWITPPQEAEPA